MTQERLQKLADSFLPLFDDMPSVTFYPKGTASVKCVFADAKYINPKIHGSRFIRHEIENGDMPYVIFSPRYLNTATWESIEQCVKHELIHAWFHWKGKTRESHGRHFIRKAIELGLTGYHAKAHTKLYAKVKREMSKE